jgi:hypothetical protein
MRTANPLRALAFRAGSPYIFSMKVTSPETIEALNQARGEQSWDEFIAKAPRTRDGAIVIPRPKGSSTAAKAVKRGSLLFGMRGATR